MGNFGGYEIDVPFGPAAGVLNGANQDLLKEQAIDCLRSPAGVSWLGSITWNENAGLEALYGTVYYHNSVTGQTVNAMGLPNIGRARAARLYQELKPVADDYGKLLIPSVEPGHDQAPLTAFPLLVETFAEAGAPVVEVNYGCPNKLLDGGRRVTPLGYDIETIAAVEDAIFERLGRAVMIIRKLPFYRHETRQLIPQAAQLFNALGRGAVNLSNTIGNQAVLTELAEPALQIPDNLGGLSGPATKTAARRQLSQFKKVLSSDIKVVSSLGVTTGQEVYARVTEMGADLTSGATVYIEGEKAGKSYGQTSVEIAEQYVEALEAAT